MLPSNEKQGSNRFWPYPNIAKHFSSTPQEKPVNGYQVNLVALLKEQVHRNMALAEARKKKGSPICFDIERTKRDDTMDKYFEALA